MHGWSRLELPGGHSTVNAKTPVLLVFLKYPVAGSVKTRLASSIGEREAAEHYGRWITSVLEKLQSLRRSIRIVGCFDGAAQSAFLPWDELVDDWWPQPEGDLGRRLELAFAAAGNSEGRVAAIGTDCLDLDADLVRAAFEMLAERDVVFGPATDGGYYLVGTSRPIPGFFAEIPWSTANTLAAHLERCRQHGYRVGLLPKRSDIDTWEDLLQHRLGAQQSS